jgi:hypothetical protein
MRPLGPGSRFFQKRGCVRPTLSSPAGTQFAGSSSHPDTLAPESSFSSSAPPRFTATVEDFVPAQVYEIRSPCI